MILTVYQSEKDVEISSKKFIANLHVFTVAKQTKLNTYQFNKVILFSTCIEKFYIKLTKHADAKLKWGNKRYSDRKCWSSVFKNGILKTRTFHRFSSYYLIVKKIA